MFVGANMPVGRRSFSMLPFLDFSPAPVCDLSGTLGGFWTSQLKLARPVSLDSKSTELSSSCEADFSSFLRASGIFDAQLSAGGNSLSRVMRYIPWEYSEIEGLW